MAEKDIEKLTIRESELEAIRGGVGLKKDGGFFTPTSKCSKCGCADFKVVWINDYMNTILVQCKECGTQYTIDN